MRVGIKRKLNIDTKFLPKKTTAAQPVMKQKRLGMYLTKMKSKSYISAHDGKQIQHSETLNNTTQMSDSKQQKERNLNKDGTISKPSKTMVEQIPKLSAVALDIYKQKTIDINSIKKEISCMKEIATGLTKYCSDLENILTQLCDAVKNAQKQATMIL